jgi:hypothetical protein
MTSWVVQVTYQASAASALADMQQRTLEEKSYQRPWTENPAEHADKVVDSFIKMGLYNDLLDEMKAEGKGDTFDRLRNGEEPRDRVEAVLWSGAEGTKSILDVEEVSPLERNQVTDMFREIHPDVKTIRANLKALYRAATLQPQYLVGYSEGLPAAIFFFWTDTEPEAAGPADA